MGRPKGSPASPAQRAAGKANLAKGRAQREAALKEDTTTSGDRWAMLLDGRLTVKDLTDREIQRMKVKGRAGSMSKRAMPSHIAQAFADERLRRAKEGIARLLPTALEEAQRILEDPDAKDADKIKILQEVINRNLGKTPDVVRIESEEPFDQAMREVLVERDLNDMLDDAS